MNLTLSDTTPVQKTNMSLPHHLYTEVTHYSEDLLNSGWITKSQSPYSAPVVCITKKDGGLRLCIDYRELNRKTEEQEVHLFNNFSRIAKPLYDLLKEPSRKV